MRNTMLSVMMAACAAACAFTAAVPAAHAGEPTLTTELFASGLASPMYITHAPGDPERLFVIQRGGIIRVFVDGVLQGAPFMNISSRVSTSFEGGLLGIAFHPEYQKNGKFYLNYTRPGSPAIVTVIAEYHVTADPNVADPNSEVKLLEVQQNANNHNAGWIGFSPIDGYLYIPLGDGGGGGGGARAQDIIDQLLGKILRIDVNGDDFPADPLRNYAIPADNPFVGATGDDEIWARGLRNPFRDSFDRETGDLWLGDVGQSSREEIDFIPAKARGNLNFAWDCMEGFLCLNNTNCTCNSPALWLPVHDYSRTGGVCAVTGGAVYRGCAIPDLQGTYFFGDYCSGQTWSFRYDGATMTEFQERTGEISADSPVAYGEDYDGEMYVVDLGGSIRKIVPVTPPADKNENGIPDACEEMQTTPGDLDGDGDIDVLDLLDLLAFWGDCGDPCPPSCAGDITGDADEADCAVDVFDLLELLANWG